jgi:aspartyl-tRNA(Asn)/glutamyl-tRNA(Gln) amidotransferase subunit A
MPLSWTLDHVGFLAPRAVDLPLLFDAFGGFDRDWTYARRGPRFLQPKRADPTDLAGMRIGKPAIDARLEPDVADAWARAVDVLARLGATIVPVELAGYDFTRMRREGLLVSEIEGATFHKEALERDPDGFSASLREMLAFGAKQTAVRAAQAYRRLAHVRVIARRAFADIDAMVLPTTPQAAFPFSQAVPVDQADLTGFANIVGIPAGCVPFGTNRDDLPLSVQVMAPAFEDRLVLDLLTALESALPSDDTR